MAETIYCGERVNGGDATVWKKTVQDEEIAGPSDPATRTELDARLDLRNHSPTGFEWGYGGSGPAQLALALITDATGDDNVALATYQRFKWAVVASLPWEAWRITDETIREAVADLNRAAPPPSSSLPSLLFLAEETL